MYYVFQRIILKAVLSVLKIPLLSTTFLEPLAGVVMRQY